MNLFNTFGLFKHHYHSPLICLCPASDTHGLALEPWGDSQISDASHSSLYRGYAFHSRINERWTMYVSRPPDTEWVIEGSCSDQSRVARKAVSLDGGQASAASYRRSASPANEAQQTRSHLSVNGTPFRQAHPCVSRGLFSFRVRN